MKKLLKSEVYKIHEQCTGALFTAKSQNMRLEIKNKKERKKRNANVDPCFT